MTAIWIVLSIVAWLLIGIAFARHFRVALVELADMKQLGIGWLFILGWPVYGLALLWMETVIRLVDFATFGDHLANVARSEAEMADGLEKMARVFDDFAHHSQRMAMEVDAEAARVIAEAISTPEQAYRLDPFRETEPDAKEEAPHGEW